MRDCKKFCWRKGSYTPVRPQPAPPQEHNYSLDYLTTEALEAGTISFNIYSTMGTEYITSISYSTDNGDSWTTVNNVDNKEQNLVIPVSVSQGDKVLWKGDAQQTGCDDGASFFSSDCEFNVYGNVMSLLYEDDFSDKIELNYEYQLCYLFSDYDEAELCKVVDASNLILPATTLVNYCYSDMFWDCTSLTAAPELPAITLAENCYDSMFDDCSSLTQAPELPATELTDSCYSYMFSGCTSLTTAPELPATTLADNCYEFMFGGCTSLMSAPALPATTLVKGCYQDMFSDCTSLNYIKCLATNMSVSYCTLEWVRNVAATGTFVKDASMASWTTGDSGIPSGWTVQDA